MGKVDRLDVLGESNHHVVAVVEGFWHFPLGSDSHAVSAGPGVVNLSLFSHIDALFWLLTTFDVDILDRAATGASLVERFYSFVAFSKPTAIATLPVAFAPSLTAPFKFCTLHTSNLTNFLIFSVYLAVRVNFPVIENWLVTTNAISKWSSPHV